MHSIWRDIWIGALLGIIFAILLTLIDLPDSDAFELFSPEEVSLTYRHFAAGGHDPLITENGLENKTLSQELDLNLNINLLHYFYWNNTVHSMTDRDLVTQGSQFRMVGWEFGYGMDFRKVSASVPATIGYYHYSQHLLDASLPYHSPVHDAIELKVFIYQKDKK